VAALVAAAAAVGVAVLPARATDDPVNHASQAASQLSFTGQVRVIWADSTGEHNVELSVASRDGSLDVRGPGAVLVDRAGRMVRDRGGWTLFWGPDEGTTAGPDLTAKYTLAQRAGPPIAGRATNEIDVVLGPNVRERVDVDQATGMLLQRAVLNPDGTLVRLVRFDKLDIVPSATAPAKPPALRYDAARPAVMAGVRAPYQAPLTLSGGYRRVGVFRQPDGLHVVYSDGLEGLSVFEAPGSLSVRALPVGGLAARVGTAAAGVWAWPGAQVVVWQERSAVYTVIGDGPISDVLAAAASLPPPPRLSWSQRLRHACRRLVGGLAGW
jgi:hypothetical protein